MMSKHYSSLVLAFLTLIVFSTATEYYVQCYDGATAAKRNYKYGTYCNSEGILLRATRVGTGCTTKKDRGIHPGGYCACKIRSNSPSMKPVRSDINDALQQRSEDGEIDLDYVRYYRPAPTSGEASDPPETSESSEDEVMDKRQNSVLPTGALNSASSTSGSSTSLIGHISALSSTATSSDASSAANSTTSTHQHTFAALARHNNKNG